MSDNKLMSIELSKALIQLEELKLELLGLGVKNLATNNKIFATDLIILGAIKRTQSTTSALITLIKQKNMTCSKAVLRIHLDTLLRLNAFNLVNDPQELASYIIADNKLKNFTCKKGNKLTDFYLVENLKVKFTWIEEVYRRTSAYIHFSGSQIYDSVDSINSEENELKLKISSDDQKYKEESWLELVYCSHHCLKIIMKIIAEYGDEKTFKEIQI